MELPPPHVLAQLDAIIVGQSIAANDGGSGVQVLEDDDRSINSAAFGIHSSATSFTEPQRHALLELDDEGDLRTIEDESGGAHTTSSRFWGVSWDRRKKKWRAQYYDVDGKRRTIGYFDDEEEAARAVNKAIRDAGLEGKRRTNAVDATGALVPKPQKNAAVPPDPSRDPTAATSKFWGVTWNKSARRWEAYYKDAAGKKRSIGRFDDEEEAARAYNAAIRRAGLEGKRRMNAVDATGALVPKPPGHYNARDRSAVVAPDPARDPTATTSKFWGVHWGKRNRRWHAYYIDANGKRRHIGYFDTQEAAARAVNAAIRRAGLESLRHTNPVVDGQLVPRALKAPGHGESPRARKRRREMSGAAVPSTRARRRPRRAARAVNYDESEPDADDGWN